MNRKNVNFSIMITSPNKINDHQFKISYDNILSIEKVNVKVKSLYLVDNQHIHFHGIHLDIYNQNRDLYSHKQRARHKDCEHCKGDDKNYLYRLQCMGSLRSQYIAL